MSLDSTKFQLITPPVAFSQIIKGIYRCSHPSKSSFNFLLNLNLKLLICCDNCEITNDLKEFCRNYQIQLLERNVGFNQEPFVVMNEEIIREIIEISLSIELSFFIT